MNFTQGNSKIGKNRLASGGCDGKPLCRIGSGW